MTKTKGRRPEGAVAAPNTHRAGLARLEIKVLLEEMFARNISIEIASEPDYVRSNFVNGLEKLMVRFHG